MPSEVSARVRELKRIDEENHRLLKRLQSTKAAVNMSKFDQEHKVQQRYMKMRCEHQKEDWLMERAHEQSMLAAQMAVRAASKAVAGPVSKEPPGPTDAECIRLLHLQAGNHLGSVCSQSTAARPWAIPGLGASEGRPTPKERRSRSQRSRRPRRPRESTGMQVGPNHRSDLDEAQSARLITNSLTMREMWGDVDVEDVDDSEHEDSSDQEAGFHGRRGNGTSESDRVYQQLLRQGAEPAVIGQKRKAASKEDEVEMELFTPDAAKKARLIPDEGRRPMRMGMGGMGIPSFGSFFF
eukprot:s632_g23.t1